MKAELDVQAGITDGKEGESGGDSAPMAARLITGAVGISTHLFSDKLLSGSLQEEQKPLIRLFSHCPHRPQVSFTLWGPVHRLEFKKMNSRRGKASSFMKVGGWPELSETD